MAAPIINILRANIPKKCLQFECLCLLDRHTYNVLSPVTPSLCRRWFTVLPYQKNVLHRKNNFSTCSKISHNLYARRESFMLSYIQNKTRYLINTLENRRLYGNCLPITSCVCSKLHLDNLFNPSYNVVRHRKISYDLEHGKSQLEGKQSYKGGKENIFTVPNLLTFSRIVATPFLGYMVLHEHFHLSLGIFACAGITDLLDGYIARNFSKQTSALGTALDPLADKLLVIVLTLSLTSVELIPMPLTALIVFRDVALIASVFYIRYISLPPPKTMSRYFDVTLATAKLYPSMLSKINTALQLSLVAMTLAAPVFHYVDHPLLQALWYATGITTFLSGLTYMLSWRKNFKVLDKIS